MKRYKTNTPRTAFALAAAALTALTIGVAVVLPAHADVDRAPTKRYWLPPTATPARRPRSRRSHRTSIASTSSPSANPGRRYRRTRATRRG